jgi:hypothetical protein
MKVSNEDRLQGCRFEGTYEIEGGIVVVVGGVCCLLEEIWMDPCGFEGWFLKRIQNPSPPLNAYIQFFMFTITYLTCSTSHHHDQNRQYASNEGTPLIGTISKASMHLGNLFIIDIMHVRACTVSQSITI